MNYYISYKGQVIGPMTAQQIFSYSPTTGTLVSTDGRTWQPLYTFPELMQMYNTGNYPGAGYYTDSRKLLCGLMAIFFGTLGIQYFILGKIAGGFITILLSIVTCGFWGIITVIQGIMMICMSDSEFTRKYVDTPETLPLF